MSEEQRIVEKLNEMGASPFEISRVQWWIQLGWQDCANLDYESGGGTAFTCQFEKSLQHPDAAREILYHARRPDDGDGLRDYNKAETDEAREREWALYWFRFHLKDQHTIADALRFRADDIKKFLARGDGEFFRKLGISIGRAKDGKLNRSGSGWIRRGWVALGLWHCDMKTAEERCRHAAKAFNLNLKHGFEGFAKAWDNAKHQ